MKAKTKLIETKQDNEIKTPDLNLKEKEITIDLD